ncbi:MAG: hypothetical protein HUU29_04575 [Planctomycetaceae bacterium]|nr:hypothetical protein [Planctomycetaceae bacterium]
MLVPLYGFLEGDTLGLLVLAHDTMNMGKAAELLVQAAKPRVTQTSEIRIVVNGLEINPSLTVAQAGLTALARFDVRRN